MFTINEKNTLIEEIGILAERFISQNIKNMSSPKFETEFHDYILNILLEQLSHLFDIGYIIPELDALIYYTLNTFVYRYNVPKRSLFNRTTQPKHPKVIKKLENKLEVLKNIPQPEQRTEEWYLERHERITASNAYKCLGSEAVRNSLIYEKCQPVNIPDETNADVTTYVNTTTPFHHGQRYEPVSVLYYEYMNNTKVGEFGCIPHGTYSFIGASPDGINIDKESPLYGRMLEIKNIVNRDITGIPKLEYWVQMQMQMETCELNDCDFLETRFVEYGNKEDYYNDGTFQLSEDGKYKGIIKHFINGNKPHYEYCPFNISEEKYKEWEEDVIKMNSDKTWLEDIYWKLDEISCVLVLRNRTWFNAIVGDMKTTWDIILKERQTGYQHRRPNTRKRKEVIEIAKVVEEECSIIIEE